MAWKRTLCQLSTLAKVQRRDTCDDAMVLAEANLNIAKGQHRHVGQRLSPLTVST